MLDYIRVQLPAMDCHVGTLFPRLTGKHTHVSAGVPTGSLKLPVNCLGACSLSAMRSRLKLCLRIA